MFRGAVIRSESIDPEYRVKFSYNNENIFIHEGVAVFIRRGPTPKVVFDDYTDYLVEKAGADDKTIQYIKLEIGKTVCDFIFTTKEIKRL